MAQADDLGVWAIEPGRRRPGHGGTLLRKLRQENHELEDCLNYTATPSFKKEKEKNKEWFASFLLALSTLMTTHLAVASHTLLVQGLTRASWRPCLQFSGCLQHSQSCFNRCVPTSAGFPSVAASLPPRPSGAHLEFLCPALPSHTSRRKSRHCFYVSGESLSCISFYHLSECFVLLLETIFSSLHAS